MLKVTFDASLIIGMRFNFNAPVFQRIEEFSNAEFLEVYLVDIVDREIVAHIESRTEDISTKVSNALTSNRLFEQANLMLSSDQKKYVQGSGFRKDFYESAISSYFAFKERLGIKMISSEQVSPTRIFNRYFDGVSPFSKTGKKKFEFPDAFALEAVIRFFNGCKFIVVTYDQDWVYFLEDYDNASTCKSMWQVLTFLPDKIKNREYRQWIFSVVDDLWSEIENDVRSTMLSKRFTVNGADNVQFDFVEIVDIHKDDCHLHNYSNMKGHLVVAIVCDFSALASYDLPGKIRVSDHLIHNSREYDMHLLLHFNLETRKYEKRFKIDLDVPSVMHLDPYDDCPYCHSGDTEF